MITVFFVYNINMGYKYDFKITTVNDVFLSKEVGISFDTLKPSERDTLYKQAYYYLCNAIQTNNLHWLKPKPNEIEEYLENGFVNINHDKLQKGQIDISDILDKDEREYFWKMAIAQQMRFDKTNGRTSMIRGEDKLWIVADDAKASLDILGLVENGTLFN